jgi:FkbM family methyltransferase
MHFKIIQVGSHIGASISDPVFNNVNEKDRVILIEPIKEYYDKLIENYDSKYPNNEFIFINSACSNSRGEIVLYQPILEDADELPIWTDEITSILPDHAEKHGLKIQVNAIICDAMTLDDVIQEHDVTELDILCIDTEGHDYEVLEGLDLNVMKPKAIFFEHKHMEGSNRPVGSKYHTLMKRLIEIGYELIFEDGANTYVSLKDFIVPREYLYRE